MRTWSVDELATFLAFTAQDRELALYHVAAATGMPARRVARPPMARCRSRWGPAIGQAAVHATREIPRFRSAKEREEHPHNRPRRETVDLLREQRERQLFERRAWGKGYRADLDLVFCRPGGSPEDPNVVGRRFGRRIRDLARLPAIGLHGLRHTHATLLLEEGVDVKTVSERLGHDSVQTTLELYGHVTPKMRGNAAARFGSLLNSARVALPKRR